MLKDFLREAVVVISGKQVETIADILNSKKPVNEFIIAKKLDITINQTRNILYRLSDHGLVSSMRKKDKKKGWYTYFWKIEVIKALEFLRGLVLRSIEQINNQMKSRETKQYYVCERCSIELTEENALVHDFMCGECGGIFTVKDNSKVLRELERNLGRFHEKLKVLDEEIAKENAVLEKKRAREEKKEKVEKAKKREEAAKKRAAQRKATAKKTVKKVVKKKAVKKKVAKKKAVKKKVAKKKTANKKTKSIKKSKK